MDRIRVLAKSLNFIVTTKNGSRTFGPSRHNGDFKPEKGSEVFVGRLPQDAYEDEIYEFFSKIGPIFKIKLILRLNGLTKGFAFVTFMSRAMADKAVRCLKRKHFRPNHPLFMEISVDHCTLLLENVEGMRASLEHIEEVISSAIQSPVEVTTCNQEKTSFLIEIPEHQMAYRVLKDFPASKVQSLWGMSATLDWQFHPLVFIRKQYKERRSQRNQQLLRQMKLVQENHLARFLTLSPDSGVSSNHGSDSETSPNNELQPAAGLLANLRAQSSSLPGPNCELSPRSRLQAGTGFMPEMETKSRSPQALQELQAAASALGRLNLVSGNTGNLPAQCEPAQAQPRSSADSRSTLFFNQVSGNTGNLPAQCEPAQAQPRSSADSRSTLFFNQVSGNTGNLPAQCEPAQAQPRSPADSRSTLFFNQVSGNTGNLPAQCEPAQAQPRSSADSRSTLFFNQVSGNTGNLPAQCEPAQAQPRSSADSRSTLFFNQVSGNTGNLPAQCEPAQAQPRSPADSRSTLFFNQGSTSDTYLRNDGATGNLFPQFCEVSGNTGNLPAQCKPAQAQPWSSADSQFTPFFSQENEPAYCYQSYQSTPARTVSVWSGYENLGATGGAHQVLGDLLDGPMRSTQGKKPASYKQNTPVNPTQQVTTTPALRFAQSGVGATNGAFEGLFDGPTPPTQAPYADIFGEEVDPWYFNLTRRNSQGETSDARRLFM